MTVGQQIQERMQKLIAAGFTPKEAAALIAAENTMNCEGCKEPIGVDAAGAIGTKRYCQACYVDILESVHPDDCTCDSCRAAFDAVMWSWLTPAHVAIVEREARTGDIPTV